MVQVNLTRCDNCKKEFDQPDPPHWVKANVTIGKSGQPEVTMDFCSWNCWVGYGHDQIEKEGEVSN